MITIEIERMIKEIMLARYMYEIHKFNINPEWQCDKSETSCCLAIISAHPSILRNIKCRYCRVRFN